MQSWSSPGATVASSDAVEVEAVAATDAFACNSVPDNPATREMPPLKLAAMAPLTMIRHRHRTPSP